MLFPEGVVFTTYDAGALWAASRVLLERIEEEGLRARLDAIVHPSVMQSIERASPRSWPRRSGSTAT